MASNEIFSQLKLRIYILNLTHFASIFLSFTVFNVHVWIRILIWNTDPQSSRKRIDPRHCEKVSIKWAFIC